MVDVKAQLEVIEDHFDMAIQAIVDEILAVHPEPHEARARMAASYAERSDRFWGRLGKLEPKVSSRLDWHLRRTFGAPERT